MGNAVNQVHRLLKNTVPSREYVLVTTEALHRLPAALQQKFSPHREEYDLGAMECGWMDLAPLRSDPRTDEEVKTVDATHAELTFERVYDAPSDRLWAVLTDPAARTRWMGVQRVDYQPGARQTMVGGEYHCYHGHGETATFRIMDAKRPGRLTTLMQFMEVMVWSTTTLTDLPDGRTGLLIRYHFDRPNGIVSDEERAAAKGMLEPFELAALERIAREVEQRAEAVAPNL